MRNLKLFLAIFSTVHLALFESAVANSNSMDVIDDIIDKTQVTSQPKVLFAPIWYQSRDYFSISDRAIVDTLVLAHPELAFNDVTTVNTKLGGGKSGRRVLIQSEQNLNSIEFFGEDDKFATLNGKTIGVEEAKNLSQVIAKIKNLSHKVSSLKLSQSPSYFTEKELVHFNNEQLAKYLTNRRMVYDSALKVLNLNTKQKAPAEKVKSFVWHLIFRYAQAVETAKACLTTSGFTAEFTQTQCDPNKAKRSDQISNLSCPEGKNLCNPFIYGLNRRTGEAICIDSLSLQNCQSLSPVTSQTDVKELLQSMGKLARTSNTQNQDRPFRGQENAIGKQVSDAISEAVRICEESNQDIKNGTQCQELVQRKAAFNSFQVDIKASLQPGSSPKDREAGAKPKGPRDESSGVISAETKKQSCDWFCSISNWLTTPTGIASTVLVSLAAVCVSQRYLRNGGGYCAKKKSTSTAASSAADTTAASAAATITPTYTAPTTPTSPDYTGVAQ